MKDKKRVVVGLSGGVDSSVTALLLIEQGYQVEAVYLECYNESGCRTDQDKADALKIALKLEIPFKVLDFRKEYKEKVIEYFYHEYEAGKTPNPDVMCNREIKFGIFYDWARENDYDYVATGHYCRIVGGAKSNNGTLKLQMAKDKSKDQSYFLWQIPQENLRHILFPLGDMNKTEVRELAKKHNLVTANKPDSMGICFIGDINVNNLLKARLGEKVGDVILKLSSRDEVVGSHKGLWFYTIGERGGFQIDKSKLKKMGMHPETMGPLYVIGKNIEKNELVVGSREATMTNWFEVTDMEVIGTQVKKFWVRIRNLGEPMEVKSISNSEAGKVNVQLVKQVFGVASGQSAVFYDSDGVLVGGSIIV